LDGSAHFAARLGLVDVHVDVLVEALVGLGHLVGEVGGVVARVEERVLGQADVDEGGLHSRQDVGDDALVDAAYDLAAALALDVQLGEDRALLHGDARLGKPGIDDDTFTHGSTSLARATTPICTSSLRLIGTAASVPRGGARAPPGRRPSRSRRNS